MSDFILPDIGEGIVECEVVEWRVSEGDEIVEDQPVVEVMTDKTLVEITAPEAGRVTRLYVAKGEIAKVHAPLFSYVGEDEEANEPDESNEAGEHLPVTPETPTSMTPTSIEPPQVDANADSVSTSASGPGAYGRTPASPAVRRLVREHGLSLTQIPGSGKQGRVLKEDILDYLDQAQYADAGTSPQAQQPGEETGSRGQSEAKPLAERIEPIRGIRAVMARRMVESASTIPHFHYGDEIDVTELLALRERLKPLAEAQQVRLTLMPFFMKAMALAVHEEPLLNARLNQEVSEIHYLSSVNIGMTVNSRAGLLVPNVKGVERRSMLALASEVQG